MNRNATSVVLSHPTKFSGLATEAGSLSRELTMNFDGVGEIIATRQLYYFDETNRRRIVSIFVGKPQPSSDAEDYQCLFQVIGLGHQKTQVARGQDSIQALQSALILAAASLNHLNEELGRKLTWEGGASGELGFP
ncbi:MAG TPA: hypothetical protein VNG94_05000 [Pyrinomonadaceae bacterium]|nr:hypothetical protein [Pyrinomonadaceae bacterium]